MVGVDWSLEFILLYVCPLSNYEVDVKHSHCCNREKGKKGNIEWRERMEDIRTEGGVCGNIWEIRKKEEKEVGGEGEVTK